MRIGISSWRRKLRAALWALAACLVVSGAGADAARAASIDFTLEPFTGDPSQVHVSLDDMAAGEGKVQIQVAVSMGVGDIRGIFFDLDLDPELLEGLMVMGDGVGEVAFGEVTNLGRGSNLNGGGSPCPCDIGIEIGRPGLRGGDDDYQMVTLVLMHEALDLDLSMFQAQSFGVRLTSVGIEGIEGFGREGSSKLGGVVPEPSTGLLLATGLALVSRRRRT